MEFNWDDHPIVAKASDNAPADKDTKNSAESGPNPDAGFNWDDHPIVQHKQEQQVGAGRAALVGAGQGATFGFGEELTAPVVAAAAMTHDAFVKPEDQSTNTLPGESTWDKYSRLMQTYRDTARDEQHAAQSQQPGAYTGGAVAGGLLTMKAPLPGLSTLGNAAKAIPGVARAGEAIAAASKASPMLVGLPTRIAAGAGEGAAYGAGYGAGEAEGGVEDRLQGAKSGAETGAMVGTVLPVAGGVVQAGKKLAGAAGELPIVADTVNNFTRGVKGENLITSSGRRQAADLVSNKGQELFQQIKDLQGDIGGKIEDEIQSASDAGTKVNLTEEVNTVLGKLKEIKASGSKDAANYAASVEAEIKKVLGIKPTEAIEDLSQLDGPEGLNKEMLAPKEEAPGEILVDPKKAQDLKQVLSDYTPRKGMAPQEIEPAGVAKDLRNQTGDKLSNVTDDLPALNEQYGAIKDALKRLKVNEKQLPGQIKDRINSVVSSLDKENLTGDQARSLMDDVLDQIRKVNPAKEGDSAMGETGADIADRYQKQFDDLTERLQLANKNIRGGESHGLLGTARAGVTMTANAAGKVANALGANSAPARATGNAVKSVVGSLLDSGAAQKGVITNSVEDAGNVTAVRSAEPYKVQRQVASAAENADPDTLKQQAQNVRTKYGQAGSQLATILENMAGKNKDSRRALMFTILQNPAHRKMMGFGEEDQK